MKHREYSDHCIWIATGGFTHDLEMRKNFLSAPVLGGCAAVTNEGDFVNIGSSVGAQLRNMNYAWMCPIVLEKALNHDPSLIGTFSPSGDSMIYVSKHGVRVTNGEAAYNESAQAFFEWNPALGEYSTSFSSRSGTSEVKTIRRASEYGRFIVPPGTNDDHVIKATMSTSWRGVSSSGLPNIRSPHRQSEARARLCRQSRMSMRGSMDSPTPANDLDFHRGERPVELLSFNGPAASKPTGPDSDHVPDLRDGALLCRADDRRKSRHEGRAKTDRW